jgi:hypothetical protein
MPVTQSNIGRLDIVHPMQVFHWIVRAVGVLLLLRRRVVGRRITSMLELVEALGRHSCNNESNRHG